MKHRIRIHKAEPNTGALDFSHLLDAPAGKHGFVKTKNGHFAFEDGSRARFIGFDVAARSNTPDHETAEKLAARFASMGVNVIRLHAADAPVGEPCTWSACREAPLLDYSTGTSRVFNPAGRERFDYFFAKLKEKGIYLHIDLLVARDFLPGDELDYPGGFPLCSKAYPAINERLIELQMEYAKEFLTHVNPYTGLAIIDDPAVMTIQLSNEESAIKGTEGTDNDPAFEPYRNERKKRFNAFLLAKYHTRKRLAESWTFEGVSALKEEEDPENGTVETVSGGFYQPVNDPMGPWDGPVCPARYADYMEFGMMLNRRYYQRMRDFVRSLGARVPIACSNLVCGAADVYGHTDGDVMEQDSYFNHPLNFDAGSSTIVGPTEYVSTNPLTIQRGAGAMATTLLTLGSTAAVRGKPFTLAEWNEYGLHPFHSTSFVHTVAYACLNDWDALILYNHHTSENWDDQPADEIRSIFDAYNDPALICQWGFMASVFLKGLVSPAKNRADVVFTQNDLRTLPNFHAMPQHYLSYVANMRNVFLDGGDQYQGDADLAVNAGFLNGCDLSAAEHAVWYSWSPYRDAWRKAKDTRRLTNAARDGKNLVFEDINAVAGTGDFREFAEKLDAAMKRWGLLREGTGLVDGALISDTGELCFDPDHARFFIRTPYCGYFSGAPTESVELSGTVSVKAENERISLSLLPVGQPELHAAKEYLLTAIGTTGMDGTTVTRGSEFAPGLRMNIVTLAGKLYAETLEGELLVKANAATLEILSPVGEVLATLTGEKTTNGVRFKLDGSVPGVAYRVIV